MARGCLLLGTALLLLGCGPSPEAKPEHGSERLAEWQKQEAKAKNKVAFWIEKQEVKAKDKVAFWIEKASKTEDPGTKCVAAMRLEKLDDPRALPVLRSLMRNNEGASPSAPFPAMAASAVQHIEGGVRFRKFVSDPGNVPKSIEGCKKLILASQDAFYKWEAMFEKRRLGKVEPTSPRAGNLDEEIQYLAAAQNRAADWLLKQRDERAIAPLCMVAYLSGVPGHLRSLGKKAVPYLSAECASVRIRSVAACLPLLTELDKEGKHIAFVARFLYCDDDRANDYLDQVPNAAARALARYGEKALPQIESILLKGRNERAAHGAACCAYLVGGKKAAQLLAKAIRRHRAKPHPNTATIDALMHYYRKIQEAQKVDK